MRFQIDHLSLMTKTSPNENMNSTIMGLDMFGVKAGLNRPHRLADFLAQLAHESNNWKYDREIWGPTAAQKRYEGRKDLGNTQAGDGSLFRGYTPMQITGRYNTTKFYLWCKSIDPNCPDFTKYPHLMNTDPWEGLAPIWYWTVQKGKQLINASDIGDFRKVTVLVNGGVNGLQDRYNRYGNIALVLLSPHKNYKSIAEFQKENGLVADGKMGPKTHLAMYKQLFMLPDIKFGHSTGSSSSSPKTGLYLAIAAVIAVVMKFILK